MSAPGKVPARDLRAFRRAVARAGLAVKRDAGTTAVVYRGDGSKVRAFNLTRGIVGSVRPALAELRSMGYDVGDVD